MIKRVTITGADDNTDPDKLRLLSHKYPDVEWGILISRKQEGSVRFPTRYWQEELRKTLCPCGITKISAHMCGSWVRELLKGTLNINELPPILYSASRVQINMHAEPHEIDLHACARKIMDIVSEFGRKEFIFQLDGVNDHILSSVSNLPKDIFVPSDNGAYETEYGVVTYWDVPRFTGLIDASHGGGISPETWPNDIATLNIIQGESEYRQVWEIGYAGGIGPDNIEEELKRIDAVAEWETWIDMEGKVRTPYSGEFHNLDFLDLEKVEKVLQAHEEYLKRK